MIIGQTSGFSRTIWQWRGTRITAPLRSSAHHQRSYVENRGATVEKKYDQTTNRGWVSVGIDHDTAYFATETLRRWWLRIGSKDYPQAAELLVVADGGGSNSSRGRLWKVAVQRLADQLGLTLSVCHFPPGTSKWNKIEHRMFCHITENWRGVPLRSLEIMVNLIGQTTTRTGLRIEAELDTDRYEVGLKVSDAELAAVQITRAEFHGNWNYKISPRSK
jgi:hypothetical protein